MNTHKLLAISKYNSKINNLKLNYLPGKYNTKMYKKNHKPQFKYNKCFIISSWQSTCIILK